MTEIEDDVDRSSHSNRFEEDRISEQRDKELRARLAMNYFDSLSIPTHLIPEGVVYRYIRESILGEPDDSRMIEMGQQGWEPVPAERHPELCAKDMLGRMGHMRGFIYRRGLILCERKKVYDDIQMQAIEAKNNHLMNSIPGTENFMGERHMPASINNSQTSYVTAKNRSFGGI